MYDEMAEDEYRALAQPVRRRLLRLLADSPEPRDIQSLATSTHLHPNTVRGHLEVLEQAGMVTKTKQERSGPGRPRMLYQPTPGRAESPSGGYRLLAEMLTTSLHEASTDPGVEAERAGRAWGRYLTESIPPTRSLSATEAVERIVAMLDEVGFEPEAVAEPSCVRVDLLDCPFRHLARAHPEVVCSLHMGMLRGAAEALGGAAVVDSLEPFVEPSLCRTTLSPG